MPGRDEGKTNAPFFIAACAAYLGWRGFRKLRGIQEDNRAYLAKKKSRAPLAFGLAHPWTHPGWRLVAATTAYLTRQCAGLPRGGMLTFPLLGTQADIKDKLAFAPHRCRRLAYQAVCGAFPGYTVFIGGSSSYDIVPLPITSGTPLGNFVLRKAGIQLTYFGDHYGPGATTNRFTLRPGRRLSLLRPVRKGSAGVRQ